VRNLYYPHIPGRILAGERIPKVSFDVPQDLHDDVMDHVGDRRKFVTFSEAVRTALRKMLDQFDEVDERHGRLKRKATKRKASR